MKNLAWIWKWRRHWTDIRELFEHRTEILRLVNKVSFMRFGRMQPTKEELDELIKASVEIQDWLEYCATSKIRPVRPWPPPPPSNRPLWWIRDADAD